jgi:uncharacterized protein YndB with AHSA1/START domain
MSVTNVDTDIDNLTLTLVADFAAPPEKVWQLWADPRKLERWWGPPTFPATVEEHDLSPGGTMAYFFTGPDGEQPRGWWRITAVNPPKSLEFVEGFAGPDGTPVEGMPTSTMHCELTESGGGTRMQLRAVYDSREQMEELVGMGMVDGLTQSVGQMDAILQD